MVIVSATIVQALPTDQVGAWSSVESADQRDQLDPGMP